MGSGDSLRSVGVSESKRQRFFYAFFFPLGVGANLGLGLLILASLNPTGWPGWLEVATGALCCLIAGWLAAALWSHSYWQRMMVKQVGTWQGIVDTFFKWVEDAPVPADAVRRLRSTLEDAVPTLEHR